jgi:hypothetical protein
MAGALGGLALANGCRPLGALPDGYRFFRAINSDDFGVPPAITAAVMTSSATPVIYFHGTIPGANDVEIDGVFRADMDYGGPAPRAVHVTFVLPQLVTYSAADIAGATADVNVARIGTGDVNAQGHYATTIAGDASGATVPLSASPGVFLYRPEDDVPTHLTQVVRFGDPAPDGSRYGGIFTDVALADDDSVTFVSFSTADTASQLLVHAPRGDARRASVLLRTGEMLPQSNATLRTIGLVDLARDGRFVAQVTATPPGARRLAHPGTALVQGRVGHHHAANRLLAASPELPLSRGAHRHVVRGSTFLGPRIARNDFVGHVVHGGTHDHRLFLKSARGHRPITATGRGVPRRGAVGSVNPPVLSDTGLSYHTETLCDGSSALTVSNGSESRVLLSSGDLVDGKVLTDIHQGYHPAQVDADGRIVFMAEFYDVAPADPSNPDDPLNSDPDNVFTAIVVGIPT